MTSLEAVCLGPTTLTDEHSREERAQCSERLRKHYSMGETGHRGSQPKVGKNEGSREEPGTGNAKICLIQINLF